MVGRAGAKGQVVGARGQGRLAAIAGSVRLSSTHVFDRFEHEGAALAHLGSLVQVAERMRILIVGAGIAGMTLAALLARRGIHATLIERAPNLEHAGYMLGREPSS